MLNDFMKSKLNKIAYPVLLYYFVYNLLYILFNYIKLNNVLGTLGSMGLSAAITAFMIYYMFYRTADIYRPEQQISKNDISKDLTAIALIIIAGILINVLVTYLPVNEWLPDYEKSQAIYTNATLLEKIIANGLAIPIMEELVFRGVVCGQLSKWYSNSVGIVISALLFGIMHGNILQFLYAFVMGLLIGYFYTRTNKVWVTFAGHAILNIIVCFVTFTAA